MTRSDGVIRAVVLGVLGACVFSSISLASGEGDEAAARVLFDEGRKLAATGDYAAACPKFEESFRLDAGIGAGFNLADCWEHIGRTASAWGRFLAVAAAAKTVGQSQRERVARDRAAALEPTLPRLTVTVTSPEAGLVVKRGAVPVGSASWGVPVPVDPGSYVIEATAPRKKAFSITVTVGPSADTITVAIAPLEAALSAPPAEPPLVTAPLDQPASARNPRSPVPAIVVGTVGIAALAAGAIFGLQFQSANDDAKKLCPTNTCSQSDKTRHDQLVSEARTDRSLAFAGAAVGGVALVTAALLWWRPGPLGSSSSAARVRPSVSFYSWGAGLGANLEGRW